jgi:hypothetical protein
MSLSDVGIVRPIDRAQGAFAPDAALEFFSHLAWKRFFDRVGATSQKEGAGEGKSDGKGLQARRILNKVMSDK